MSDIVERLRDYDKCTAGPQEAANEIERLRAENEKLREALKPFADKAVEADKPYAPDITEDYWLWRAALAAIRESGE